MILPQRKVIAQPEAGKIFVELLSNSSVIEVATATAIQVNSSL